MILAVVACSSKKQQTSHDGAIATTTNYGDDPTFDALDVDAAGPAPSGPITIKLPVATGGQPAIREGVIGVALVGTSWRQVDPRGVAIAMGSATIPDDESITAPEVASRAQAAGVLVLVPDGIAMEDIHPLAFALHNECWALAATREDKLVAHWPKTCPPGELPGHDRPVIAMTISGSGVWLGTRTAKYERPAFGEVAGTDIEKRLREERARDVFAKRADLIYATGSMVPARAVVDMLDRAHAAGWTDARWVPPEWVPMRFPSGVGTDPPPPPPPPPPPAPPPIPARSISVAIEKPTVAHRNVDEVDRVIKARAGVFRACFQRDAMRDPNMKGGKLVVSFEISPEGVTTKATIGKSKFPDTLTSCVTSNFMRIRHPTAAKHVKGRVVLTFALQ